MSYNIDTWKTKRIENLVIPFSALYDGSIRQDWRPAQPQIDMQTGEVVIDCGCEQHIRGFVYLPATESQGEGILGKLDDPSNSSIRVTEFDMTGEGSGTFWHECLRQALEKSTGLLEVVRVWEGGDYIDRLRVRDGVITEEEVSL